MIWVCKGFGYPPTDVQICVLFDCGYIRPECGYVRREATLPANRNAVSLGMSLKADHRNCAGQALVSAELCEPFRLVGQINLDSLERDTLQRHQSMHQRGGLTVRDTR